MELMDKKYEMINNVNLQECYSSKVKEKLYILTRLDVGKKIASPEAGNFSQSKLNVQFNE